MSFAFHPSYNIPVLTHTPSVVLIWAPLLCSFVFSPVPAAQLPQPFTGQYQTRAVTVSLRWEISWAEPGDVHDSEWLIQQSSVELDKDQAANYASSFVMPAAKRLNSEQPTLSSIAGNAKCCLRCGMRYKRCSSSPPISASLRLFIHLSNVISNIAHKCCGQRCVTRVSLQCKGHWAPANWF